MTFVGFGSNIVQGASLRGRCPPAVLAQIEQTVKRTEVHDLVQLYGLKNKSSTPKENSHKKNATKKSGKRYPRKTKRFIESEKTSETNRENRKTTMKSNENRERKK